MRELPCSSLNKHGRFLPDRMSFLSFCRNDKGAPRPESCDMLVLDTQKLQWQPVGRYAPDISANQPAEVKYRGNHTYIH